MSVHVTETQGGGGGSAIPSEKASRARQGLSFANRQVFFIGSNKKWLNGAESAVSLAVVTQLETRRPPPPAELTPEQSEEWRAVASTMPSGWFGRESYPLLASYCWHVCRSRWLASKIDTDADRLLKIEGGVALLDKLFAMAEREGRAVLAHARSLRLTQQSRYDARTAGRQAMNAAPASYYESMEMDDDE